MFYALKRDQVHLTLGPKLKSTEMEILKNITALFKPEGNGTSSSSQGILSFNYAAGNLKSMGSGISSEVDLYYGQTTRLIGLTAQKASISLLLLHTDWVMSVAFSHDNSRIASAGDDKSVVIWDAIKGVKITDRMIQHGDRVTSVSFSRDGNLLASGGEDGNVVIWKSTLERATEFTFKVLLS